MADKKQNNIPQEDDIYYGFVLPRLPGNQNQDEFFSINGKNYIIQRGKPVNIPMSLYKMILDNYQSEEDAIRFANSAQETINKF